MRQYGYPEGTGWDSDREFRAAKARAVEDRLGDLIVEEQLDDTDNSKFLKHELLDRAYTASDAFERNVVSHPAMGMASYRVRELAHDAATALNELYQAIGEEK